MLEFKISNNIVEIKQSIHGFTKTITSYWYYDIDNWMVSSTGHKDSKPDRKMNQKDIDWFKKYHLPKVKKLQKSI